MTTQEILLGGGQSTPQCKLATVTRVVSSRPYVKIDGEADESPTPYPYAAGLTFAAANRVLLQQAGSGYVIVCKITV